MKSPKRVYLTRGDITVEGATIAEAKEALDRAVNWACRSQTPILEFRFGCVLFAAQTPNGWQSGVAFPDRQAHGKSFSCPGSQGADDREVVLRSLREHAARSSWTHDSDDAAHAEASGLDEAGQRELRSYFGWQRAYREATRRGASASEAHEIASGRKPMPKEPACGDMEVSSR